jgi:hypothetical protein
VSGNQVVHRGTEGKERVYAVWTVLVESNFMEVGICRETTKTMGCLGLELPTCQDVPRRERGVRGCRDGGGFQRRFHQEGSLLEGSCRWTLYGARRPGQ